MAGCLLWLAGSSGGVDWSSAWREGGRGGLELCMEGGREGGLELCREGGREGGGVDWSSAGREGGREGGQGIGLQ